MRTALLLITHGRLGEELVSTVHGILGDLPLATECISVPNDSDPELMQRRAAQACERLDSGAGVLVLTDLYGSTPSNIANRLIESHHVNVVSGVNAPMLLRIMNYPDLLMEQLGEIALTGARNGIMITTRKQAS